MAEGGATREDPVERGGVADGENVHRTDLELRIDADLTGPSCGAASRRHRGSTRNRETDEGLGFVREG